MLLKKKKITKYIFDHVEISSDSARENSDEENSDEESFDEKKIRWTKFIKTLKILYKFIFRV